MNKYLYAIKNFKIKPWIKYYLLKATKNALPNTYQEVEYLENTGTQYIRTDIVPTDFFKMEIKFYTKGSGSFYCAGSRPTVASPVYFGQVGAATGRKLSATINGTSIVANTNDQDWTRPETGATYEIRISTNGDGTCSYNLKDLTENKEFLSENNEYTNIGIVTYNMYLFALNPSNIVLGTNRCYYFKLYEENELIFYGIPCYRKSDNKPGMYDTVNGVFYTNEGTGEFNVGKDVLPDSYQEVEYLESTGTQYIDTGYAFTEPELKIEGKYRKSSTLSRNVYGLDFWPTSPRKIHGNIYNKALYLGNSSVVTNITQDLNEDYIFKFEFKNNVAKWVINETEYTYNGANGWEGVSEGETDYLFASRGLDAPGYLYNGRIYYVKFYNNNDKLVRNFIPCYRKSDNKPGMYDTVNNVFYTNVGTGEFNVGSEV